MIPARLAPANPRGAAPATRAGLGVAAVLLVIHLVGWCQGLCVPNGRPISRAQVQLRMDANTATAAELDLLPRVGKRIAENIIAYRQSVSSAPAFRSAEDLDRVLRIGPVTVELLRPYLRFPAEVVDAPESLTP